MHEVIAYRTLRPETLDPEILGGLRRAEIASDCLRQPLGVSQFGRVRAVGGAGRAVEPSSICGDWVHHRAGVARSRCARRDRVERFIDGGVGGRNRQVLSAPGIYCEAGMTFPVHRPRRLRRNEALRGLVRETRLTTSGLVYPMFACPGKNVRKEVSSMPGIYQQSSGSNCGRVPRGRRSRHSRRDSVWPAGAKGRDSATEAAAAHGAVQRSIEAIRKAKLNLLVITDVCLCEYTSHGHCGVIKDGEVLNDPTLVISRRCGAFARAGRRRYRRAVGHDGRARRRDSPAAG